METVELINLYDWWQEILDTKKMSHLWHITSLFFIFVVTKNLYIWISWSYSNPSVLCRDWSTWSPHETLEIECNPRQYNISFWNWNLGLASSWDVSNDLKNCKLEVDWFDDYECKIFELETWECKLDNSPRLEMLALFFNFKVKVLDC